VIGDIGEFAKARHLVPDVRVEKLRNLICHTSRLTM
jgi:hypothetical protein